MAFILSPLARVRVAELVVPAIERVVGVTQTKVGPVLEGVQKKLASKKALLILDNFEHVIEARQAVADILSSCPHLKVLVTSREVMRLRGEHEMHIGPLLLPDRSELASASAESLATYEAVRLFVERVRQIRPDFSLTDENKQDVVEICLRLDGLPLALELAASHSRVLPPAALLSRLKNKQELPAGGAYDSPARHRTLSAAMEWSHDLLSEPEMVLFRRLAVFVNGCTLEAAEAVCNADGELPIEVLQGVDSLVSKSLLGEDEGPDGAVRPCMLATISEYAQEKLSESREQRAMQAHHASYFLALVEQSQLNLQGPDKGTLLDKLEAEHDNFRAALVWALQLQQEEIALRMAAALADFWLARGYYSEGRQWLNRILAACRDRTPEKPTAAFAKALLGSARLANQQSDTLEGRSMAEESLQAYRTLNDKQGMSRSLAVLADSFRSCGEYQAARPWAEESLSLSRELGARLDIADSLSGLGSIMMHTGDSVKANLLFKESLAIRQQLGEKDGVVHTITQLAALAYFEGNHDEASSLTEQCLILSKEKGDRQASI